MNSGLRRTLAWGLLASTLAILVTASVLALSTETGNGLGYEAVTALMGVVFGVVGVLIASRHPSNSIGWIFLGASVFAGLSNLSDAYATFFIQTREGPHGLGEAAAAYGEVSWMPFILVPATFLLLLFPEGRLLSPRWRWMAWCAGIGIAGVFVFEGVDAGPIPSYPQLSNPFGVRSPLLTLFQDTAFLLVRLGVIGSAVSVLVRFRRARGVERQQLKWLALAGGVAAVPLAIGSAGYGVLGESTANTLMALGVLSLPVAAGIAILRYRLYDIDVVINRTVVYGALSAILAAFYLGSVLLLQLALSPFTEGSSLAVAVSTLTVAALFRPVRARIQNVVDRRFFRSKYDANRTLEQFSSHLRDKVDLEDIGTDLLAVVGDTVQPRHVSLWLRGPESAR